MVERELTFEASLHSGDAIQRAAYALSDRLSCDLAVERDRFRCTLHLPADADVDATVADFRNEVLDQTLRERIRDETHDVRNLVLALAFSNTGLVDAADA
jgi:His-Xaa-Ser system protein HxsD